MWSCHYLGKTMEIRENDLTVYTVPVSEWMIFDELALERNC